MWNAGEWWADKTGLPLPLGVNAIRRDLGTPLAQEFSKAYRKSIEYAHAHKDEAVKYALQYGRGLDTKLGEQFIGNDKVALILGDNIFYGQGFDADLKKNTDPDGGVVFAYHVSDPERYGVVEFDANMQAVSIEEKPTKPKSNYAQTGLYFYDNSVIEIAKNVRPSDRGELEITTVNQEYLKRHKLKVAVMDRGTAWLDTGTFESMMQAAEFVRVIEERQGQKIGSIEEAAWREGFIDDAQLRKLAEPLIKSGYGEYLMQLLR